MFPVLEENLYHMAGFRGYRLFPVWFQTVSGWFQVVLNSSRLFQVGLCFSKYIDILIKKCRFAGAYSGKSVGRAGLGK